MAQYRVHEFIVQVESRRLVQGDGQEVELTPRLFDALLFMVEHPGKLLSKDLLLQTLWPGVVVEENSLSQSVSALRKALGDDAQKPRFIQTVPRRGFRFVAPVVAIDDADADRATSAPVQTSGPVPPPAITSTDIRTAPAGRQRRRWALLAATGLVSAAAGGLLWRASRPGPAVRASNTLAVLPFKPIAEASRDELLEVGMAESLVARLSSLPGVAVRSVGSVRRYAGAEQDPIRAARELQVTWIIDGSVQRAEGRVRVTARLLNTASGEAAWSGSFDETVTSVFDLQDVISRKVAAVLAPHLERSSQSRLAGAGGTRNLDAYQLYLAARQQAQGLRTAGLTRSIALYQRAIALDPQYALAYSGMGESYRRMVFGSDGEPLRVLAEAARCNEQAVALDPELAEGHAGMGWMRFWHDWNWSAAAAAFERALALNASEAGARLGYSLLLSTLGRSGDALVHLRLARESDPLSLILLTIESGTLAGSGRVEEARERLQRVFDIDPDFWVAHLTLAGMQLGEGKPGEAINSLERADELADGSSQPAAALGFLLARQGQTERARRLLKRLQELAAARYVPPTSLGLIHAGLNDKAAALSALERGIAVRDVRMTLLTQDARWSLVRGDPRYSALLRTMNLA